jgi:signal transduction histidine kinase
VNLRTPVADALWRGLNSFRVVTLLVAVGLGVARGGHWEEPLLGAGVLGLMTAWTVVMVARSKTRSLTWRSALADILVCLLVVSASAVVVSDVDRSSGAPTVSSLWAGSGVLTLALLAGPWAGVGATVALGALNVAVRGDLAWSTMSSTMTMVVAALLVGFLGRSAIEAERAVERAAREVARAGEREALSRDIHDSVLQSLAMIARKARASGLSDLSELAADAEAQLRSLVSRERTELSAGDEVDLNEVLTPLAGSGVEVVAALDPVLMEPGRAEELVKVVKACLDNVTLHAGEGASAHVVVEDEDDEVVVTVRDDGVGFEPGRLRQAEDSGRMGVSRSIRGRAEDLGGVATVTSSPRGTEVEVRVPTRPAR